MLELCILGWAELPAFWGIKNNEVLCLFRQTDIHKMTFDPLSRLQQTIFSFGALSMTKNSSSFAAAAELPSEHISQKY